MHRSLSLLLLLATGCAAPAFVGQVGRVTPRRDVRLGLGAGYQVGSSAAAAVRDGRNLARRLDSRRVACPDLAGQQCWTLDDVRPAAQAALRFALAAPLSASTQVWGRYGFAEGLDAGVRWGPSVVVADVGWQLFGPTDAAVEGWAGSLFGGFSSRSLGALGSVIEDYLQGSASLHDYSLAFVAGRQFGQVAHLYLGGRYVYSRWKLQVLPDLPLVYDAAASQRALLGTDAKGSLHHLGGVLGGAVGYRKVFLGAELDLLHTAGSTHLLFEKIDLSTFGVMPVLYLYGQF